MASWRNIWHFLFLPSGNSALGISCSDGGFQTALVAKVKGQLSFLGCTSHERPSFHPRIASGLEEQDVVYRSIMLPVKGERHVLAALPFQLEALLPFPMESALVCPFPNPVSPHATNVSLFATSSEKLQAHLDNLAASEIYPDAVSCTPSALFRIAKWVCPNENHLLVFHMGEHKTSCVVIQSGRITLFQLIKIGKAKWIKYLENLYPEKAKQELDALLAEGSRELFEPLHTALRHELERLSTYIHNKINIAHDTPWILLGQLPYPLDELWSEQFSMQQLLPQLPKDLSLAQLNSHCIPLGYAIEALATDKKSVQFCQQRFTPSHRRTQLKRRALTYVTCCLVLSVILGLGNSVLLHKKKATLSERFLSYLPSLQENYRTLSQEEMESELFKWEQSLLKQKNSFSYFLTTPKVSEVLAWLSTHPSLIDAQGGIKEGIDIKAVHYQLTKYPTLEDPSALHQAQVEIEFTSTTPRLAREFHETLLKGDRIVNPKKEMKWNAHGNGYSIQFELNKVSSS